MIATAEEHNLLRCLHHGLCLRLGDGCRLLHLIGRFQSADRTHGDEFLGLIGHFSYFQDADRLIVGGDLAVDADAVDRGIGLVDQVRVGLVGCARGLGWTDGMEIEGTLVGQLRDAVRQRSHHERFAWRWHTLINGDRGAGIEAAFQQRQNALGKLLSNYHRHGVLERGAWVVFDEGFQDWATCFCDADAFRLEALPFFR